MISFRWETGALHPRKRGGASLQSRMREEAAPSPFSCPVAGPKSSFFVRKEGRGTRCYKPRPLCHSAPLRRIRSPGPGVICGRGPPPSPVSRVPGASPPPVLWPCPCPRGRERRIVLPVPRRLRGLHGRILFPRCHWAMWWRGGSADGRGALVPDSRSASRPQASLSDHG